jgi:hypothetical protein
MSQQLNQLKKLVLDGGFDGESRAHIAELERQLQEAAASEKLAELPTIAKFIEFMRNKIVQADVLLTTDRTLTELERQKLFERKDICDYFLTLFNGEQTKSVEQAISEALSIAQGN